MLSARDTTGAAMQATARRLTGRKGGNGSLMRTAAVGIAYLDDADGLRGGRLQVSALTHDDERAHQACQLWSSAIRHAVLHGTFDGSPRLPGHGGPRRRRLLAAAAGPWRKPAHRRTFRTTAGWCTPCRRPGGRSPTPTSATPDIWQRALELAVRAGHDTDTTAAIAGALLGARWGASAVPARWRRILHGWPGLRAKDLIALAARTANGGHDDSERLARRSTG